MAVERFRSIAQNRRARYDYFIDETLEAGLILHGTEVKSLRNGRASLNEAYAGEASGHLVLFCLLYTSPSPRDGSISRMPSSA